MNPIERRTLLVLALSLSMAVPTCADDKPETPHLAFVTEYVRELAAIEGIRDSGQKELTEASDDPNATFSNMIHTSTLFQLELGSQIRMLKDMNLKAPYNFLIPDITAFYEQKIALWQRMVEIGSAFMSPKPGVDYGKLTAELPKIRAKLDYVDESLFQITPAIFATLIDIKPDSRNHVSHLVITKAEKTDLIDKIDTDFGSKLDEKGQNYTVGSAKVLKDYLLKDYKCSDEPWVN